MAPHVEETEARRALRGKLLALGNDEVRELRPRMGRTASGALGYRQVLDALYEGQADSVEVARQRTVEGTRRFARRQERRFRQDRRVQWVPAGTSAGGVLDLIQGMAT